MAQNTLDLGSFLATFASKVGIKNKVVAFLPPFGIPGNFVSRPKSLFIPPGVIALYLRYASQHTWHILH